MKLKPLLPSLREKKRYLAFKIEANKELTLTEVRMAIERSLKEFTGDLGVAKAGMIFLKDWKDNTGIVRVNTKSVDTVKASLALIKQIDNQKVVVKSLGVSGVINKIRKSYF